MTKNKASFPHEDALRKQLFIVYEEISKKWNSLLPNWPLILTQLAILFEGRVELDI